MMRTAILAALVAACCWATPRHLAAQDTEFVELDGKVREFFATLDRSGDKRTAFDQLLDGSVLSQSDRVDQLVLAVGDFDEKYGRYLEVERVDARSVGKDVRVLTYLYKAERFPLVWRFIYYRPPTTEPSSWRVVSLKFDTDLRELLALQENAGRQ